MILQFRSFHFPYVLSTPSSHIFSKHESCSTLQGGGYLFLSKWKKFNYILLVPLFKSVLDLSNSPNGSMYVTLLELAKHGYFFLAFSKYTLENILFNLIKNDCFLLKIIASCLFIFCNTFLKCNSKIYWNFI